MSARKTGLFATSGVALVALAGLMSVACGSGDDNGAPSNNTDGGSDATVNTGDAGDAGDASNDATTTTTDSGDAGTDAPVTTGDASDSGDAGTTATCAAVYPAEAGCTPCGPDPLNACSAVSQVQCYPFTVAVPDASF